MNLRQMEAFRAVMHAGTITGAANTLNISQPSVSNLIKHTEDQAGLSLFSRVKGRLEPTPEAFLLLEEIERAFEHVRLVNATIDGIRTSKIGSLSIASFPSLIASFIPAAIGRLLADSPDTNIYHVTRGHPHLVDAVATRAVDIGFGFFLDVDQRVRHIKLAQSPPICIFPSDSPLQQLDVITPRDVAQWKIVGYSQSQLLSGIIERAFRNAGVRPKSACVVESILTAWEMVRVGAGIAIVDPFSAPSDTSGRVSWRRFECDDELRLDAIVSAERNESVILKKFLGIVQHFLASDYNGGT